MNKTSQYGGEKYPFQHRFAHTPKPGMHSKVNSLHGTFPTSSSRPCHTPGQRSGGSFSNLTGMEKNDLPMFSNDVKDNSSVMHSSDIDQYLDHMMEEEAGLYYEENFLKGDDVDDNYDAFSPLHADDHNCAMQTSFNVPPGNCNTIRSNSAGIGKCRDETMASQREKKSNENRRETVNQTFSKTVQMKLPFAGRKRLIDQFFDTGENACSGINAGGVDSRTTLHSGVRAIDTELDGYKLPAFSSKKHAYSSSAKPSKQVEISNSRLPNNCLHHDSVFSNFPSIDHEKSAGSRQTDSNSLGYVTNNRSLDKHLLDRNVPKQLFSGVLGKVEGKEQDVAQLNTAVESPHNVDQHFPPGPTPCSFFAVGPGDRYI